MLGVASALNAFSVLDSRSAMALGRTGYTGRIRMSLPWTLASIDPHDVSDPGAALFGNALFDSLYTVDARGVVNPLLADTLPVVDGSGVIVKLRPGLKSAKGVTLDARDAIASIARAKKGAAGATLAKFAQPQVAPKDSTALVFPRGDRYSIARALASPLTAIVPRSFDPRSPDGTGPFSAAIDGNELKLSRNLNGARGAAFLDSVTVGRASDLADSLRSFEAERDDIGWLGSGLFGARKDASKFDLGKVGWIVLSVGPGLGDASNPGGAQKLCDDLPRDRLAHLGLGPIPSGKATTRWSGPPAELVVDASSPHLVETAQAIAGILSMPDHEISVKQVSRADAARRRKSEAVLALGVVRPLGPAALDALLALTAYDDLQKAIDLAPSPPKSSQEAPRASTRNLRTGILGDLRVAGGIVPGIVLETAEGGGWDLGASFVRAKKTT